MVPISGQDLRFIILIRYTVYLGLWFQPLLHIFPRSNFSKTTSKTPGPGPHWLLEDKNASIRFGQSSRSSGHREAKEPTGRSGHKMSAKGLISNFAPWRVPIGHAKWFGDFVWKGWWFYWWIFIGGEISDLRFFGWSKGHDWKKLVDYKMFYPRHPGPPPEVLYLDPKNKKNIPKAALQEVFGRLGSCLKL